MKLEQISYILEIAKQGSIGKAAKKLYMSQPNLSMSIRMLEEELGFKIFDRSNSGVELTAKGMELLQYGEEIERNMDLIRNMNTIAKDEKVNFRISSYYIFFIKHIILELSRRHKDEMLNLIINQDTFSNVIRDVETGLSDIGIIKITRPVSFTNRRTLMSKNLEFVKVTDGHVYVQVREGHPLCSVEGKVDIDNLKKYVLLTNEYVDRSYISMWIGNELDYDNFNNFITVQDHEMLSYFLHETDGVYFSLRGGPMKDKTYLDDGTVLIPLSKKITLDCGYIKRKDEALSPIAEEFVNIYKEFAEMNDLRD